MSAALLLAVGMSILASAPAWAWSASINPGGELVVVAAVGEPNVMSVADEGPEIVVDDLVTNTFSGALPAACTTDISQLRCPRAGLTGVIVTAGDQDDAVTSSTSLPATFYGEAGNDVLVGSSAPDTLDGGADQDVLEAGDGADMLAAGDGNDEISAGDGADHVDGQGGNDQITGEDGTDTIDGGPGEDNVDAGKGEDVAHGGPGIDTLSGDLGADTLSGGEGDDQLDGSSGADTLMGGEGTDVLEGGSDDDALDAGPGLVDLADGGDGNDTLSLQGGQALGGQGDDTIAATATASVEGNDGNDTITGGGGDDTIDGGAGDDSVYAGEGADIVDGNTGADSLHGGSGTDELSGGPGSNELDGAPGNDVLIASDGPEHLKGGAGTDTVDFSELQDPILVTLNNQADDGAVAQSSNVRIDVEHVIGTFFDDILVGGPGPAVLDGSDGNDTLTGGSGSDVLHGEGGDDLLIGALGADVIDGGEGEDRASYVAARLDLAIAGDGIANDGAEGERDNVTASVERILTGAGRDTVTVPAGTASTVLTAGGNDVIHAADADGQTDDVHCGGGADTAEVDGTDLYGRDCETVIRDGEKIRSPLLPRVGVKLRRRQLDITAWNRTLVIVHCSARTAGRCHGTVTLSDPRTGRRVGRTRFSALAGETRGVRVRVPRTWMKRFRQRGPHGTKLRVTVVARASAARGAAVKVSRSVRVRYRSGGRG